MCAHYSPATNSNNAFSKGGTSSSPTFDPASTPLDFDFKTVTTFYDRQGAKLATMLENEQLEEAGIGKKAWKRHQSNLSPAQGGMSPTSRAAASPNAQVGTIRAGMRGVRIVDQKPAGPVVKAFRRCMGPIVHFAKKHILPVPIDHDLYMTTSIWAKARRYRHIPYFFIVNILLCGLLFGYIQAYQLFINDYVVQSRYALSSMIVGAEDETDKSLASAMKDITEVKAYIMDWVDGYYSIPMQSSGVFQHFSHPADPTKVAAPQLELKYATDRTFREFETIIFDLTEDDPLGPLGNVTRLASQNETCMPHKDFAKNRIIPCRNDTVADFFDLFVSASVSAYIRGVVANPAYKYSSSLKWSFSTNFVFESHNSQLVAKTKLDYIETQRLQTAPVYVIVVISLIAMYGIVSKLNWYARHSEYPNFAKSQGHIKKYTTAKNWNFYGILADTITLTFAAYTLVTSTLSFSDYKKTQWKCILLGSSAFVQVLFIVSHFQNVARMYVIAQSIGNALPNLGAYFVSVFPMFFGFCVCASAAFGGLSDLFESLPLSMVTFFSMVGGDSLLDIYTAANVTTELPLQIFTAMVIGGFIIFFIGCMLNMMLAIVQDSYQVGRALNDMDERVMKEIRREDAQREMIEKNYAEARKSGLDGGFFNDGKDKSGKGGGGAIVAVVGDGARKAFRAAMVGADGDSRQQTRYDPFSVTELMSLRKRFFVQPRRNVGIDVSSSSSSSSSEGEGSEEENEESYLIDDHLRKAFAFEQRKKLRNQRAAAVDSGRGLVGGGGGSSFANTNTNSVSSPTGPKPYSPRASALGQGFSSLWRRSAGAQAETGTASSMTGMNSQTSNREGGEGKGETGVEGRAIDQQPRSSPQIITAARAHARTYDEFDVVGEEEAEEAEANMALLEVNSVDTEYLLSNEGYSARDSGGFSFGTSNARSLGAGRSLSTQQSPAGSMSYGRRGGARAPASFYNQYESARAGRLGRQ